MSIYLFKPFFVFVFGLLVINSSGHNRVYYVDQLNGNDSNSGKKPQKAWATISKINNTGFRAGDKILFCGGQIFQGTPEQKEILRIAEERFQPVKEDIEKQLQEFYK